jgi:hypothetical protein
MRLPCSVSSFPHGMGVLMGTHLFTLALLRPLQGAFWTHEK